ncbi:hypothetical protein TNCV_2369561 [Trichonephila clavipes]|nr:hypothetical protein TNCV_2369561 [Trichonephila clavipes]
MAKLEVDLGTLNRAFQTQTGVSGTIPKTEPAGGYSVRSVESQGERLPYKTSAEGEDEETFEHLQSREGSSIR